MAYTKPGKTRNRIYQFMRKQLLDDRHPTVREVQKAFQMRSVQSVKNHLNILVREGLLNQEPGKARGYRLPDKLRTARLAPVVGNVPAGPFNIAIENVEGYIPIHPQSEASEVFALRVSGDSMMDAGILAGDIVVVRRQSEAYQGDIVVAMVEDEATVKEFWRKGDRIELRPRNDAYSVLSADPGNLVILGKVIEVRRYFEGIHLLGEEDHG